MQNYTKLNICLKNIQLTVFVYFYIILSLKKKEGLFVLTLSLKNDPDRYLLLTMTFSLKPLIV